MLGRKPSEEAAKLDAAINRVYDTMIGEDPTSDRYSQLMKQLQRLHKLKSKDKKPGMSRDAMLYAGAGFAQVALIVIYEQKHAWTTKALSVLKRNPT
jgi:hypothetical protein